jgi:hypothetical protein
MRGHAVFTPLNASATGTVVRARQHKDQKPTLYFRLVVAKLTEYHVTMLKTWPWFPTALVVFLIVCTVGVAWPIAFDRGSRQSSDLVLTSTNNSSEVMELRAQLLELRRAEDRLLTTVLAGFGAGITVLALVNIGVVVAAHRNYDRDKEAIQNSLTNEIDKKVQAETKRTDDALFGLRSDLTLNLEQRLQQAFERTASELNQLRGVLTELQNINARTNDSVVEIQKTTSDQLQRLELNHLRFVALLAANTSDFLTSARFRAMEANLAARSHYQDRVPSILDNFNWNVQNIPEDDEVSSMFLDEIEEFLNKTSEAMSEDPEVVAQVQRAIERVALLRERDKPEVTSQVPDPPPIPGSDA